MFSLKLLIGALAIYILKLFNFLMFLKHHNQAVKLFLLPKQKYRSIANIFFFFFPQQKSRLSGSQRGNLLLYVMERIKQKLVSGLDQRIGVQ